MGHIAISAFLWRCHPGRPPPPPPPPPEPPLPLLLLFYHHLLLPPAPATPDPPPAPPIPSPPIPTLSVAAASRCNFQLNYGCVSAIPPPKSLFTCMFLLRENIQSPCLLPITSSNCLTCPPHGMSISQNNTLVPLAIHVPPNLHSHSSTAAAAPQPVEIFSIPSPCSSPNKQQQQQHQHQQQQQQHQQQQQQQQHLY